MLLTSSKPLPPGMVRSVMSKSSKPDLLITDLSLPGRNGLELIKDLGALHPGMPILVLSLHDELLYAERVLRAGGRGYVMKNAPTAQLIEAIHCVLAGGVFTSPSVAKPSVGWRLAWPVEGCVTSRPGCPRAHCPPRTPRWHRW